MVVNPAASWVDCTEPERMFCACLAVRFRPLNQLRNRRADPGADARLRAQQADHQEPRAPSPASSRSAPGTPTPSPPSWPRRRTPIPPASRPGWQPTPCSASAVRWSPTSANRCWLANTTGRASPANSAPRPDRRPRCSSGARSARRLRNPPGKVVWVAARAMSGGRAWATGRSAAGAPHDQPGIGPACGSTGLGAACRGHQRVCRLAKQGCRRSS
jgi:hypothetical protein